MDMAKKWFQTFKLLALVLLLVGFNVPLIIKPARALAFNTGDVFASVSDGKVQHYNDNGVLLETLDTGLGGYTTGMAFDAAGSLYVTCWDAGTVFVFDNTGAPKPMFVSGLGMGLNSIVFDAAGNAYVGYSFIGGDILKFDSGGNYVTTYDPGGYGGEFIDLAADQTTMFYTGWGEMPAKVKRFGVGANTQLTDFATTLPGLRALDFRLLPNGELLLANYESIVRLDSTGSVVQTYDAPGEDNWYSLALDPDGTSFWSGNYVTNNFYKFEIAPPGNALLGPINTGTPPDTFWALAVYGETGAPPPQRSLEKLFNSTEGKLGDTIHVTITITIPPGETAEITDLLPPELKYMPGTFTVNGPPATPTIGTTNPPPPIRQTVSYTITASGTYTIEFDVRVIHAYRANYTATNQVVASFYDEEGNRLDGLEDTEDFIIKPLKELHKNVGIPKADVVFAIDLTGSMLDELAVVKAQAVNIMNNLAAQIANVQFGLISFMDYTDTYTTNEPSSNPPVYTDTYGSTSFNDLPYNLDQDITSNTALIATKINSLTSGWGGDDPESYTRVIYESYSDPNLNWRSGAEKILILFGDSPTHDSNFDYDGGGTADNTGGDPGRDAILGPPSTDDLDFETVVADAATAGVHILAIYSGIVGIADYEWQYMATQTNGEYSELPDAEQLPDVIKDLVKKQAEKDLSVRAKTDSQWAIVTDIVNPFSFTMTDVEIKFKFGVEIEVDPPFPNSITHGTVSYTTRGTTQKVFVTWNIPSLLPSETARLILLASTDFKPGKGDSNEDNTVDILDVSMISAHWTGPPEGPLDYERNADVNGDDNVDILDVAIVSSVWGQSTTGQQEYRTPGTYEMSSEAVLKFTDPTTNMQLSAETDSIYVTVLPIEEP